MMHNAYRAVGSLVLVSVLGLSVQADSYEALLRRFEKQIRRQESQLTRLRSSLAEKERDVTQWQSRADSAKSSWTQAAALKDQTNGKLKAVRSERQQAQRMANAAEWKTTEQVMVSESSRSQALILARQVYEQSLMASSAPKGESEALPIVLSQIHDLATHSAARARVALEDEKQLRAQESALQSEEERRMSEVSRLHEEQAALWSKWQVALRRKNALVEEISQIDQSAKTLQVMLQEVREHRDQTQAMRPSKGSHERLIAKKRGTLPWPAHGRILQPYGRQYSEGSNQLVVSNGIKIEAAEGATVRVVDAGKVLFASPFREYGQLIIVQHKDGLTSVYGGLGDTLVKPGQLVAPLDAVGHAANNNSFYFELRHAEQPINPLAYLSPVPTSELSSRRTFR